jgi:hypothetical protein
MTGRPAGLHLLVIVACAVLPVRAQTTRASLGLEYDTDPFAAPIESDTTRVPRGAWVSRLYLRQVAMLAGGDWGEVRLRHEWGLKRFWEADTDMPTPGGVLASALDCGAAWRLGQRLVATAGTELKLRSVHRLADDDSYLRGALRLGLQGQATDRLGASVGWLQGHEEERGDGLADASVRQAALELQARSGPQVAAATHFRQRWIRCTCLALAADTTTPGQAYETDQRQHDRRREAELNLQVQGRLLCEAGYGYLANHSNSLGYSFRGHRGQVLLTGALGGQVDGQLLVTGQVRQYHDDLPSGVVGAVADDYDQVLVSGKLSRQLTSLCGVSAQYRWARNGASGQTRGRHEQVYALSLDLTP